MDSARFLLIAVVVLILSPIIDALHVTPYIIPTLMELTASPTLVNLLTPVNSELLVNQNLSTMGYSVLRSPGMPLLCSVYVNNQQVLTMNPDLGAAQAAFSINEGTNGWYVSCTDSQGTATSPAASFVLDQTAPTITLPQPQVYSNDGNAELSFVASDNLDPSLNCNLYVNNQLSHALVAQSNILVTQALTNLSDGNYGWNVSCSDDSLNAANSALGQLVVSANAAPFLSI